jgi:outer membrane protein, multidrug efflux system
MTAMLSALLGADCTVGPNYHRPPIVTPTAFRFQVSPAQASSFADLPWWSVFNDPQLQDLITQALTNNYDLQVAVARIEQARALVGVAASEGKPQIGYEVTAEGDRIIAAQENRPATVTYGAISGFLNAAWELDLWGRIRRSTEAARANLYAQEDVRRGVMLTLVSDVASGYFQLLTLDRELAIAENSNSVFKRTLDLFTDRFKAGRDSDLPVQRAEANYRGSTARVADLKRAIAIQEDALSVLLGAYPRGIVRGRALLDQTLPAAPLSATTVLLERRPDIQAAEHNMMAANAQIGVALADYFPRVGLSAMLGGGGVGISNLFNGFGLWNAALGATGPIFTGGRLSSVYHERQAQWDETVASYKKTVLVAFQETSDALASQQNLVNRRTELEGQVVALQKSVDMALLRYDNGRASYFEVTEAEQQLFPAEDNLARTQGDQLLAVVNLYKALGGGWNMAPADWTRPH